MFLVAITFLPFLVIVLLYFIREICTAFQNYNSWPHVLLCMGKKVLIALRSSILLSAWAQINFNIEIDDEILNKENERDAFGSILPISDKSDNESDGKFEEKEALHSDLNVVISNFPKTVPWENIDKVNLHQRKNIGAKKVFKRNSDSSDEKQTILAPQEDVVKKKLLPKSQENKQLEEYSDLVNSRRTVQLLEKQMEKQKKELMIVSEWVRLLRRGNNALKTKLFNLESAKKVSDVLTNAKERNLEELLEGKSIQVQRLQCTVKMLDIENLELKAEKDVFASSEMQLKKEINKLKMTLAKIDQKRDIYLSQDTSDWKSKLDSDLSRWKTRIQTSLRKTDPFSARSKLKRWTIKRMEPHKHRYENSMQYAPTDYVYKPPSPKFEWIAGEESDYYKYF